MSKEAPPGSRGSDSTWSAADTSPQEIEAAMRALEIERYADRDGFAPARALNLVCVVDAAWSGEIANRLSRLGRYHASRTVVCTVEPGRTALGARASITAEAGPAPGRLSSIRETITVSVGESHLPALHTIVDPLVITDVATVAWAPHGHEGAVDSLTAGETASDPASGGEAASGPPSGGHMAASGTRGQYDPVAQVVLLDSVDDPDVHGALARAERVAARAYVVDLAWLRCAPWRERLAAAFDPPARRAELRSLTKVSVRHRRDSVVSGLLLLGWLCARLGWRPGALAGGEGVLHGRARARRGEVELRLEAVDDMSVPGLAGVEVTTQDGAVLGLERGAGGLTARRRAPATTGGSRGSGAPAERTWTVLGASRGEDGILGEGIRQALLRDPTHAPALAAAARLAA